MQSRCPFLSHICADDDDDDASLFSHLPKCKYTVSFNIANIQFSRVSKLTIFNIQEFQYCDIQEFVRVLIKPKLELLARQRGGHFDADVLHIIKYF